MNGRRGSSRRIRRPWRQRRSSPASANQLERADARLWPQRPDHLDAAALVDEKPAALLEKAAARLGPRQERGLREGFRLKRRGGERRDPDEPAPDWLAG